MVGCRNNVRTETRHLTLPAGFAELIRVAKANKEGLF